jgi:biotin carboxylase
VKPADSQSSIGVKKVHAVADCLNALEDAMAYSKTSEAIVEEFFTGQELVAEGFICKGKYYNIAFGDRHYFNLPDLFIPSQTVFPSLVPDDVKSRIISYEQRMAEYTSPNFAIVHSEYLYNPQTNLLSVVESRLRGGGVYISSHLIPLYSNIDINDMLLDATEGKELNIPSVLQSKKEHASAYVCFYLFEGQTVSRGVLGGYQPKLRKIS